MRVFVALIVTSALFALPRTLNADPAKAPNLGCEGQCGNNKRAADGWCGNCVDHCSLGTESECLRTCDTPCEDAKRQRDERCAKAKRENDWEAKCRDANDLGFCNSKCDEAKRSGNQGAIGNYCSDDGDCRKGKRAAQGHWCSDNGDGKKGALSSINHWCSDGGAGWKGENDNVNDKCSDTGNSRKRCLDKCGAQVSCRNDWCQGALSKKAQCYSDSDEADTACRNRCSPGGSTKCKDEECHAPFMIANCGGKKKITGFCASKTFQLP